MRSAAYVLDPDRPTVGSHTTFLDFEDGAVAYDQKDAEGFIRLNALRLRLVAVRNARTK